MDNTPQHQPEAAPEAPEPVQKPAQKSTQAPAQTPLEESPLDALAKLAQAAKVQRLTPAEEERAVALLIPLLKGGKNGILSALEPLVALPWIVGVNAISTVWPEWSAIMRRHLLTGLAGINSDQALRLRLSLARAIFKIELPAALKIAAATLPDLIDAETGTLTPKHRQIFFNVFIGKGKPWLLQLPLGDFKASDADALVHCAIETFPFCPPLSQLSILRWSHAGGRFKKINEPDLATITKSISRWSGKLQRQLKAEIEDLPETITAVFKPAPAQQKSPEPATAEAAPTTAKATKANKAPAERKEREPEEKRDDKQKKREKRERKERQPREVAPPVAPTEKVEEHPEELPEEDLTEEITELEAIDGAPSTPPPAPDEESSNDTEERESRSRARERRRERPEKTDRPERADRTDRTSNNRTKTAPFDFKESLRGLETYIASLRTELEQAKTQLRRKDEEYRRGTTRLRGEERPPVDVEALTRHNTRLEETVADLRQQLEDLASHHEAIAESRELHGDEPLPEGSAEQLCKLLSIKLQEDYETYTAMRLEPLDRVFRLDYRDLLGQVFDVLIEQGVALRATPPPKS